MTFSRFNLAPIFRGHWRGLTNGVSQVRPDWLGRVLLLTIPLLVFILALAFGWKLTAPSPLLAGVSLLAGALLSSFTHLSSLRLKLAEWSSHDEDRLAAERAMLDETAAHLLLAALMCVVAAIVIVIGLNFRTGPQEEIAGAWAAVALGVSSWVALLFIVCLPRLYSAYVQINEVADELSGFTRRARR